MLSADHANPTLPHTRFTFSLSAITFESPSPQTPTYQALSSDYFAPYFAEKIEAINGASLMLPPSNHQLSLELQLSSPPSCSGLTSSHLLMDFSLLVSLSLLHNCHLFPLLDYSYYHTNMIYCLQCFKMSLFTPHLSSHYFLSLSWQSSSSGKNGLSIVSTFSTSISFLAHYRMAFWPHCSTKNSCKRYQ